MSKYFRYIQIKIYETMVLCLCICTEKIYIKYLYNKCCNMFLLYVMRLYEIPGVFSVYYES